LTNKIAYRDHDKQVDAEAFAGLAGILLKNLFPENTSEISDILGASESGTFETCRRTPRMSVYRADRKWLARGQNDVIDPSRKALLFYRGGQ